MTRVSELSSLRNLGGKTEAWLNGIGIYARSDLERSGADRIGRSVPPPTTDKGKMKYGSVLVGEE